MSYILLTVLAQFINAVVAIMDKYIVSDARALPQPFVYAFYSLIFSGAWVLVFVLGMLPFGIPGIPTFASVAAPNLFVVLWSLASAVTFFGALVALYLGLKESDASDIMPVVGAISAISSLFLAYQFLGESLTQTFFIGVVLLASGAFILSRIRFTKTVALYTLYSGLLFGSHYVVMKALFNETNFDDGFFWSRIAFFVLGLSMLLIPYFSRKIFGGTKAAGKHAGPIILINKVLAGIAAIMLLKATDLGDVAVVQALDGLKFVFILLIGVVIGHKIPSSCSEPSCRRRELIQKSIAVGVILFGFLVLFV